MGSATGAAAAPPYLIALNELDFDHVRRHAASERLPHFERLIGQYGLTVTTTVAASVGLEPWIQWVTVHTGLAADRHGVFLAQTRRHRPDSASLFLNTGAHVQHHDLFSVGSSSGLRLSMPTTTQPSPSSRSHK